MNKNKNTQLQFPLKNGTTILRLFRFYGRESFFNWNKMHKVFSFFHIFYWVFFRVIGKLFLNLKIHGQKNLDSLKDEGVLFVANHQGAFDGLLIGASIPPSYYRRIKCMRYMMYYKFITRNPIGFIFWIAGAFPIFSAKGNLEKALSQTVAMLRDKHNVMMFPTGGRKKYFNTKDARPGVGYLAKTLNMQIVPVFIKNTHKVKLKDLVFRSRHVSVIFGKPFRYKQIVDSNIDFWSLAKKIMEQVKALERDNKQV